MEFKRVQTDERALDAYARLFRTCFPTANHLDNKYLTWLYADNPAGPVVGFDAYDDGRLAAHYSCIPADLTLDGEMARGLLSLNTATHPDFQGRGLFTKLAAMTYDAGKDEGFACVYGIANANSTPGFVRKLEFQLVRPLEARIGLGRVPVNWKHIGERAGFARNWTEETFRWRCANPKNPLSVRENGGGGVVVYGAAMGRMISAYGEVPVSLNSGGLPKPRWSPLKLFLGVIPNDVGGYGGFFSIPNRLRPSPLNLIFRPLGSGREELDPKTVLLSFMDFDAY